MSGRFEWQIKDEDGRCFVQLQGPLTEDADFSPLITELQGKNPIRFYMQGLTRINSCGVREWVNFVRSIPTSSSLELEACSPVVVAQLNMIDNFAADAKVLSVEAPFACDACGHEENVLLTVNPAETPEIETKLCPKCGEEMEFDDIPESYFAFLGG